MNGCEYAFNFLSLSEIKMNARMRSSQNWITSAATLRCLSGELFRPGSKSAGPLNDLNILNILFDLENSKRQKK